MNTSTRVEFGLYDVTARSDSAPVTEDAKDFCNLSKDLLLESVPNQNKYGTLETRQWLMDGSFLFFPETPRQYFWGFWSTEQSNGNGAFANPPVLNIRFDKNHSSSGLTLHFYSPTDDWASKVKIQWYDANDGLLAVANEARNGRLCWILVLSVHSHGGINHRKADDRWKHVWRSEK